MILEPWIFALACLRAVLSQMFGVVVPSVEPDINFLLLYTMGKFLHSCGFFSDEAWFSLRGEVNCAEEPVLECTESRINSRTPCSWRKSWCWVCELCTQGNCETATAAWHVNNILRPVFVELAVQRKLYGSVQRGTAVFHTAHVSSEPQREVFVRRIISRGLWLRVPVIQHLVTFIYG